MNQLRNFQSPGKQGYILLPRQLINQVIFNSAIRMSETLAYITMLTLASYKEAEAIGRNCQRGESLIPLTKWGEIFGWTESKTRRFFKKLEDNGIISVNRDDYPHSVCMLHYEAFCGNKQAAPGEKPRNQADKTFEQFWETYHRITQLPPHDMELARREWSKLNPAEKSLALNNIGEYFMGLASVRHTRKASNYLKNKTFIL